MNDTIAIARRAAGELDADRVASKLWVGSVPPQNLRAYGFGMVVLCAEEFQDIPVDVQVLHAPFEDRHRVSPEARSTALRAATLVTAARRRGIRVLVTCAAGINRSAFVAALSMLMLEKMTALEALAQIRKNRTGTVVPPLSNASFVEALQLFEMRSLK